VKNENGVLTFNKSYHEEGPYNHEAWNHPAIMQQFRISTYINALISNGFKIEKVIEDACYSDEDVQRHANRWYSFENHKSFQLRSLLRVQNCRLHKKE